MMGFPARRPALVRRAADLAAGGLAGICWGALAAGAAAARGLAAGRRKPGRMAAATVLLAFVAGRPARFAALPPRCLAPASRGSRRSYAVEVLSVLDALAAPLRTAQREDLLRRWRRTLTPRKRSSPRADGRWRRRARLPAPEARRRAPRRATRPAWRPMPPARARCSAAAGWCCWRAGVGRWCWACSARSRRAPGLGGRRVAMLWRARPARLARGAAHAGVLLLMPAVRSALATGYHVFGTDKVGQDVLYLSLKSVRTALVIGTLTTLVMLPLAVAARHRSPATSAAGSMT
jgi:peptide/nickel transport system permease protein